MAEADRRIPSLDGIRGVLLIIVLTAHTLGTKNFPVARDAVPFEGVAYTAMRVFFIISGFLITGILLKELNRRGTINLLRFYFKRTFRIFPAYYAFLIILCTGALFGLVQFKPGDVLHAFTYTSNYNIDPAWHLGHTWSLATEEQFYLLWPAVLLLAGTRRSLWILGSLLALLPVWRVVLLALPPGAYGLGMFQSGISHTFDTVADIFAVGCLLAILRPRLWEFPAYRRLLESRAIPWLFLLMIVLSVLPSFAYRIDGSSRLLVLFLYQLIGVPVINISIAVLIDWAMRNPHGAVGRILNHRVLMFLGVISYSAYLWQQVFLNRHAQHLINVFPLNVILALTMAWLSYRLVEMPWLSLRERLDAKRYARQAEAPAPAAQAQPAFVPEVQRATSS
ncbi:MAG TPA: acyltransferase [Longimicrobiales bacterium]